MPPTATDIHDTIPSTILLPNWTAIAHCSCGRNFRVDGDFGESRESVEGRAELRRDAHQSGRTL